MARQRAPTASIHARSSLRPLRSSASTSGSASSARSNSVNASTASGKNDAAKISVGFGDGRYLDSNGSSAFTAAS